MSNEIPEELKLCAEYMDDWPEGAYWVVAFEHRDGVRIIGWPKNSPPMTVQAYSYREVLQARKDLGLVMSDEEESMPAEEWSTTITDTPEEASMVEDMVNHPPHYQSDNGIECIDAIRAALGLNGFVAHCRGTAIKYCWRSGKKQSHAEDLRKAAWYLNEAAEALEEDNE